MTAETTQDGGLSHSVKIWLYISFPIYYAEAKAFYSGFIASFKLKLVLKQFTINLKCQFNSTHSSQEPLTAGPKLRHGNWFSNGLIPPWILRWSTEKEAVMTHAVIPQFLYDVVRILPKCDKACNKSCLPSISLPAAGSRQGKPPQAKCYSSLLVFEVTASSAAEAAACGLWLVGLLKIWSLTFQVRMSHRHWSHNCSCEITQARWEERTSEQTCGLDSLSDNTTVCVCVCLSSWCFSISAYACTDATTCWKTITSSSSFRDFIQKHAISFYEFIHLPCSCVTKHFYSPFHCDNEEFICLYSDKTKWIMNLMNLRFRATNWDIFIISYY